MCGHDLKNYFRKNALDGLQRGFVVALSDLKEINDKELSCFIKDLFEKVEKKQKELGLEISDTVDIFKYRYKQLMDGDN